MLSDPSPSTKRELVFDVDDFHVFGDEGVVQVTKRRDGVSKKWSHKFRSYHPTVGDAVGILHVLWLSAFEIESVGYVVGKRGTPSKPIYDVWVTQSDPKEYELGDGSIGFRVVDRTETIHKGLKRDIQAEAVVLLRENCIKNYAGFQDNEEDRKAREVQESLIKAERKAELKRKRELTQLKKKAKAKAEQ